MNIVFAEAVVTELVEGVDGNKLWRRRNFMIFS